MNLESICTCLELSEKLFKLGINQESLFYWVKIIGTDRWQVVPKPHNFKSLIIDEIAYPALTVSELGEILPHSIDNANLEMIKGFDKWLIGYVVDGDKPPLCAVICEKEANGRATMIIYLSEKGLIKNER